MTYIMMKNVVISAVIMAMGICTGCSDDGYTINGTVENGNLNGKFVYKIDGSSINKDRSNPQKDSAVIKDGKYTFKGDVPNLDYCTVYLESDNPNKPAVIYATVALEKGVINLFTDRNNKTVVSGTPLNDSYQNFTNEYKVYIDTLQGKYALLDKMEKNELDTSAVDLDNVQTSIRECREKMMALNRDYVKNNINNPAVWYMDLYNAVASEESVDGKKELIAGANEYTKSLPIYKVIAEQIEVLEKTAVGKLFTDFTMEDAEGNKVSLSDYVGKGKYVLVDFWASWCGPCRAEMPNVVEAYKKFGGDNFEIVGVSLDAKKDDWLKAIKDMNLSWKQMSDLKAWECEGSKKYGVNGIPATVLFDREGVIIARDLRGEELQSKLEELLK